MTVEEIEVAVQKQMEFIFIFILLNIYSKNKASQAYWNVAKGNTKKCNRYNFFKGTVLLLQYN